MRRYVDASRTFQDILVFLSKISAVNSLSYQYDQMLKKQEGAVGWFVLGEFFAWYLEVLTQEVSSRYPVHTFFPQLGLLPARSTS